MRHILRFIRMLALASDLAGTVILVVAVGNLKTVLNEEMRIDDSVIQELNHETHLETIALILIVLGFLLLFIAEGIEMSPKIRQYKRLEILHMIEEILKNNVVQVP